MNNKYIIILLSSILLSILSLSGVTSIEGWFNESYDYRLNINCSELDSDILFYVNGSPGTTINNETQHILTYCAGTGLAIYYNNYNDWTIANDTEMTPFIVISGNVSSYGDLGAVLSSLNAYYANEEGTGTNSSDSIGSNHGTTDASWVAGKINYGLDFAGADNEMNISNSNDVRISTTGKMTFDFWHYGNFDTASQRIFAKGNTGGAATDDYALISYASTKQVDFFIGGGGSLYKRYRTNNNITIGASWNRLSIVVNGINNVTFYDNGVLVPSSTIIDTATAFLTSTRPLIFGKDEYYGNTYDYNGKIDEIAIWSRALSASEINQTSQNFINTQGFGNIYSVESIYTFDSDYLRVSVQNINNDDYLYDYSLVITGSNSTNTIYNNNLSIILINKSEYSYPITIELYNTTNFAYYNSSVIINNDSISKYRYYVYDYNSMAITIHDETTLNTIIGTNITLAYTRSGITNNIVNDTGYINLDNLTADYYQWKFSATGYADRYYYSTIIPGSHNSLNAYLLSSATAESRNFLLYCSGVAVNGTLISTYISINGTYSVVAQRISDGSGLATIWLNPSTTYRFIVNSIYGIYTTDITPSISPVNFYLCGGISQPYNWTTIYDKFSYLIYPASLLIDQAVINFNLTASSPDGYINSFGIYYNSTIQDNLSGSPAGGTVSFNLNLTNSTGTIPITYWFNVSGEDYYSFVKNYKIKSFTTAGNNSATAVLDTYSSDIPAFWRYIFVTIASIMVMAALSNVIPAIANTIIGFIVYIPFAIYGWINPLFLIPMGALLFVYYMVERY